MSTQQAATQGALWARGADGRGIELQRLSSVVCQVADSLQMPSGPAWDELAVRLLKVEVMLYVDDGAGRWWVPLPTVEPTLRRRLRDFPSSGPGHVEESLELPELPELRGLAGARELLTWLAAGRPRQSRPSGLSLKSLQWLGAMAVSAADVGQLLLAVQASGLVPLQGVAPRGAQAVPLQSPRKSGGKWTVDHRSQLLTQHRSLQALGRSVEVADAEIGHAWSLSASSIKQQRLKAEREEAPAARRRAA